MQITKNCKYPVLLRKFISSNITKFSMAIRMAIKYRKELLETESQKIKGKISLFLIHFRI